MQRKLPAGTIHGPTPPRRFRAELAAIVFAALLAPAVNAEESSSSTVQSQNTSETSGASSEVESVLSFPNHPGLLIIPVSVSEYTDLRVQTDRVRERGPDETEQVYEMEHPREGAVFLEFELHVSNDGEPWPVRPYQVRLQPLDPEAKPVSLRDLATESARIPLDTEAVVLAGKKILYLRFEPDKEGLEDLRLWIEDSELGSVAELRALTGSTTIETEAGTVEYPDSK